MKKNRQRVLVVFANPTGTDALRLASEERAIKESIKLSKYRHIDVRTLPASTVHDLRRALLEEEYDIVHISGHGTRSGLVLEKEDGSRHVVPQAALAETLAAYAQPKGHLECVLLNACYSISTGTFASLGLPFTIAMDGPISDLAAIEFSRGFYDALGAKKGIEFSYEEGCRAVALAAPGTSFDPLFLRAGESATAVRPREAGRTRSEPAEEMASHPLLVGFALDVSASMQGSMRNDTGAEASRLQGFRDSLQRALVGARDGLKQHHDHADASIFAYAFGLRHRAIEYADLLSLISLGQDLISKEEIERLKDKHTRLVRQKYEASAQRYGGLADLARGYLGGVVDQIADDFRANAEREVRDRVQADIAGQIAERLDQAGETTMSIRQLADLWDESEGVLADAEALIFGRTPMAGALRAVAERFDRELRSRADDPIATLFLLSDGDPTDGEPEPHLSRIHDLGVSVVSCFVTGSDIADPRTLYSSPQTGWSQGARRMFDAASQLADDSEFGRFLLRKGWVIHPGARLFVQINHTVVLNELVEMMLLARQQGELQEWQLPKGEEPVNP